MRNNTKNNKRLLNISKIAGKKKEKGPNPLFFPPNPILNIVEWAKFVVEVGHERFD